MKHSLSVLFFTLVLCLAGTSCSPRYPHSYTLHGTAIGAAEGDTITISAFRGEEQIPVGKTVVGADGTFTFNGTAEDEGPVYLFARPKDVPMGLSAAVFTDGTDIEVQLDTFDEMYRPKSTAGGSALNDLCRRHKEDGKELEAAMQQTRTLLLADTLATAEQKAIAKVRLDSLISQYYDYIVDFVLRNADNAAGQREAQRSEFIFMPPATLQRFAEGIPASLRDNPAFADRLAYAATLQATQPGEPFIDFSAPTPAGDTIRLSDFAGKGHYVLIDFWASWCGPCRAAMPKLKELYARYHDKGFEVVGVSLDSSKESWEKAIAGLELPWPQMSDLQGWKSAGAPEYGIKMIPSTFLLGPDGRIIARNAEDLEKELEKAFGE